MKSFTGLILCVVAVTMAYATYSDKWDNIDIDRILHNNRLLNAYVDCLLERKNAKCTPDANELKRVLPHSLAHKCAECTEKQKINSGKVIKFLSENKPQIWAQLKQKYDKDQIYKRKYAGLAKKYGINA